MLCRYAADINSKTFYTAEDYVRAEGIIIQQIIYAQKPKPANKIETAQTTRTTVGSKSKYSAIPAATPPIIASEERFSFFIFNFFDYCLVYKNNTSSKQLKEFFYKFAYKSIK